MLRYVWISTIVALVNGVEKSIIIGGKNTMIEEYLYQVSLLIEREDFNTGEIRRLHACGGSILNNVTILTAAHCMIVFERIRAGSTFRSSGGKVVEALSYKVHPKYIQPDYDVSVIKLKEALEFGPRIQPIEIQPIDQIIEDGTTATVTGWGRLKKFGPVPEILQIVNVKKINQQTCVLTYNMLTDIDRNVTDRMICYSDDGKDACQEDSGGPLVVGKFQVGIVSWAVGCARKEIPGVYTNLQDEEIQDFIFSQM